jgi:hypothetical protein
VASASHRRRAPAVAAALAIAALAALGASASALTGATTPPTAVGVHLTGRTALAKARSSTVLIDRGTVSGSPIGSGRITLVYTLDPTAGTASTRFTIVNARGTVTGRATSRYAVTRLHITFTGTGTLTGGTRAYAGIRGAPLAFDAVHSVTGRKEAVALTGRATLP